MCFLPCFAPVSRDKELPLKSHMPALEESVRNPISMISAFLLFFLLIENASTAAQMSSCTKLRYRQRSTKGLISYLNPAIVRGLISPPKDLVNQIIGEKRVTPLHCLAIVEKINL